MARPRNVEPVYRLRRRGGHWLVAWTENGRTRTVSTWTTDEREAERWRDQFVAGRDNPAPPPQPGVSAILDGYEADRLAHGIRGMDTLRFNAKALKRHAGNLDAGMISQGAVRRYARQRQAEGVGPGTVKRELETLRAALFWAEREGWILRAVRFSMPVRKPKPRDRWLTKDEANRLLAEAKTPHVRLFILLALLTGARKAAIQELTWDRVNLDSRIIDFGEGHGNKRRAIVPMGEQLHAAMASASKIRTTEYVLEFNGAQAGNPKKAFARCAERARLPDVTPHVLRHTAASWMVMDGVPTREVARMIGDTEEMVERVYGKHSPDYLRRAATSLEF